jgi:hypothetical protein
MIIPLKVGSKVSGSLKLPAGRVLQVTGVDKGDLLVDMGASTERIPKDKTDFTKALAKADLAAKEQHKIRQQLEQARLKSLPQGGVDPKSEENPSSVVSKPKEPSEKPTHAEAKEFTFAEIEKIVKLVEPLKTLNALKDQKKESVLRSEAHKWRQAAGIAESYFNDFEVPADYAHWLKTLLVTAEMFETGRFDAIEAKLRELDLGWITLKTDQIVNKSKPSGTDE